jgi:anti-sigma factor RsiW
MNCEHAHELLHAYLDDELDLATALDLEKHLPDCAVCQKELDAARAAGQAVARSAIYHIAPAALRDRMQQAMRSASAPIELPPKAASPVWWTRPMAFSGLAAAVLLLIGSAILFLPSRTSPGLPDELLDSHLRSLAGNHLLDVESTDQHTVKPWFAGKLDFSPPVIDLSSEGFPLVGGRLEFLDGKTIAALIYRRNKHTINLFIWPGDTPSEYRAKQGFNLIRFECKGMTCWAVSDLNTSELQHFTELFVAQKPVSTRE